MPRRARQDLPTDYNHLMVHGFGEETIFDTKVKKEKYISLIKAQNPGLTIYAYVIMDNHAHFLICQDPKTISPVMKSVNSSYSNWYKKTFDYKGKVFGDRYKTVPVLTDEHFYEILRYIHLNPYKEGLTDSGLNYPYSSFGEFFGNSSYNLVDEEFKQDIQDSYKTEKDFLEFNLERF